MNSNIKHKIIVAVFSLIFIGAFICCIIKPATEYSESERRKLNQFPEVSFENVFKGDFFSKFSDYAVDQFPLREQFRKIKAFFTYNVFMQKDNNDIYVIGDQASKMEFPLRENSVIEATEKIEYLCNKYLNGSKVYCSVIPDKNYFLAAENGYPGVDYDKMMSVFNNNLEGVTYIDIFNTLDIDDYYPTDTHWDQANIKDTVNALANGMEIQLNADYKENVLEPFFGVYYGQSALPLKADKITYLTNEYTESATVINYETGKYLPVYNTDKFTAKDPYDIFLDGAVSIIEIISPKAKTDKELIIFRDSFGSSLAPYFTEYYSKITLLDTRYIQSDLLGDYVEFSGQDVLFIYNTSVLNNSNMLK